MTAILTAIDRETFDADTALGTFRITATPRGVRAVEPVTAPGRVAPPRFAATLEAAAALRAWARGERAPWTGVRDAEGTPFARAVWEHLLALPFGATTSYGAIAVALGRAGEARAVGEAVGANPASVLVPCHRVVGADGSLRGFRWGLELKRRWLAHEGSATLELPWAAGAPVQ
jgi:methylated-DNA-[protein]-cysteine S-methyltransferase